MADQKISELTAYTPPIDTDVLPIVDVTTSITKKITWTSIKAALKTYFDSLTTTLTNKTLTSPVINTFTGSECVLTQTATTGIGFDFVRNLAAASTNNSIMRVYNQNAGDDRACLYAQDEGDCANAGGSVVIDHNNAAGRSLYIDTEVSTGTAYAGQTGIAVFADVITTGGAAYFYSNSAVFANTTGGLLEIVVDNTSATGNGIKVQNDGTGTSLYIDQNGTPADSPIRLDGCTGTSTKSPETDAEAGFIKVNIDGTARYIPYYAAS